jgi:hypothetical protein
LAAKNRELFLPQQLSWNNSMSKLVRFAQNPVLHWFIIILLIIYQVVRLVVFVNTYGGIEHDSGWFLGLARSLAETGTYTTMVSTMPDPAIGTGFDINHEFFQIQDEEGRVYFFVEGTVGPTQIIPDAFIIKLFGSGFWQFRAASLLFYFLFLILASWLLFLMGGFWAAFLFQIILILYPHLSVFLGYESLGEVPMVICILFSYFLFSRAITLEEHRAWSFFLSGLFASLAVMSKVIALLALTSLGIVWIILFFKKKVTLKEGIVVSIGFISLPLILESVQLITLTHKFGFDVYLKHAQQGLDFFVSGSGVEGETTKGAEFFWYKLFLISEISHPAPILSLVTLMVIAIGGPFLIRYLQNNKQYQSLVALIWTGWLVHSLWFIFRAETGWVRRYWVALILGVLVLSLLWGVLLRRARELPGWSNISLFVALTLLVGINFYSHGYAARLFISEDIVDYWHQKHLAAPQTQLPSMIIPRAEQEDAAAALKQIPAAGRVFYPVRHKSAEMAAVSGRILYPIERRPLMPSVRDDVLLVGPSLISPWAKLMERPMSQEEHKIIINSIRERVKRECHQIVFENDYYIICSLN